MTSENITCILEDDEKKVLQTLVHVIEQHIPELQIVGTASNVKDAYTLILEKKPRVVFLDIVMPMQSGFELIHKFSKIDFEIVFITSHQEYALDAIRCLPLAYLLKPVDTEDLLNLLPTLRERLEMKDKKAMYDALVHNMAQEDKREHKLAIFNHDATEFIPIKDIIHVEGWNRYTKFHIRGKKTILSSYNIGKYVQTLANHAFYLCHKSHLINLEYVQSLQSELKIQLSDASIVPLAVRKRQEFLDLFERMGKGR